jgi:polyhydroxybutyrate depolymerase
VALVLAVAIAAAALVAAFGAGTPASASASPARGCGGRASASTTLTLTIGGHSRTVIVHVPKGYSGRTAVALVLNLPGSGTTAADQELFTGMDATADADGFIVAYPQALIAEGNGFDWNVPGEPLIGGRAVPAGAPDDVAFLTQLVGVLEGHYCIAPTRVYATGFSGGARMASQLACDSSGVFAAVAPVSGLRRPTPCPTTRAVPVLSFHGIADPVDPYNGHGQKYWTYSVPAAAADWASQDGCSSKPASSKPDKGVTLTAYSGCRGGATVELYGISGEGHEWPDGPALPPDLTSLLGPQSDAIDANTVIWAFFAAHPLP